MFQFIGGNSPLEVRNRFLESCKHKTTFLVIVTGRGDSLIGIYAGHTEEAITLREAGDEQGEKTRHIISFLEIEKIELA